MLPGEVIYQSASLSARFVEGHSGRVVVCFPDRVHPVGFDLPGWAEGFLSKRGIAAVYISVAQVDWFQCPDFFAAMEAIRTRIGPERPIATYGSSMGGYATLLSAGALQAELCLALSPQYSIDPAVVPFERRYNDYAARIGPFIHDLGTQASADCRYVVALDPSHKLDRQHLALIEAQFTVLRLPVHGAGHGVLPLLSRTEARDGLADLLRGDGSVAALRGQVREARRGSAGYLRRMGNQAFASGHGGLFDFAGALQAIGKGRMARKWPMAAKAQPRPLKLVVHCGLPKTGTTSLQAHFFASAPQYRAAGIHYPTDTADRKDRNHAWLSRDLREASVDGLTDAIRSCPDDCHTLFLSDESLFVELPGLSDGALTALSEALEGVEVELVVFEREIEAWKRSFYLQSVQNRRPGPKTPQPSARNLWQTTHAYQAFFDLPYCRALLDFASMRHRLAAAFGASTVRVLDFHSGRDVVPVFCEAMGWPMPGESRPLQRNLSITDIEAEILRQANALKPGQARLIKALVSLPAGADLSTMKLARAQKLAGQAKGFPWDRLSFQENPPLVITPDGFDQALADLKDKVDRIEARAKVV